MPETPRIEAQAFPFRPFSDVEYCHTLQVAAVQNIAITVPRSAVVYTVAAERLTMPFCCQDRLKVYL
jgi:hypothetical protein